MEGGATWGGRIGVYVWVESCVADCNDMDNLLGKAVVLAKMGWRMGDLASSNQSAVKEGLYMKII